ncbi:hypothetical protein HDU67_007626 [Dinochytrium kinnereticum]|nr:hypothetical protein HDU67_007626 [Dinochytrium kinnereticum]
MAAKEYPRQRGMKTTGAPSKHTENVAFIDPSSRTKRSWHYPLFSISSCIKDPVFAFALPCIANARISHEFHHQPGMLEGILGTCFLGIFATAPLREEIRERLEIRGDSFQDYAVSCCCGPCALIQERWELDEAQGLY